MLICAGSVESSTCSFGKPGLRAESLGKDLGAEARPAHAEQQHVAEPAGPHVAGEVFERGDRLLLLADDAEPAEPLGLVGFGPQRRIAMPTAGGPCRSCANLRALPATALSSRLGQLAAHRVELVAEHDAALFLDRGVKLVGGVGEKPDAVVDQLAGYRVDRNAGGGQARPSPLRRRRHPLRGWRAACRGRGRHPSSPAASC